MIQPFFNYDSLKGQKKKKDMHENRKNCIFKKTGLEKCDPGSKNMRAPQICKTIPAKVQLHCNLKVFYRLNCNV